MSPVVSGSLGICLHLSPFIHRLVWLVVSGSLALHLSPSLGWWCPALWMSVFTCLRSLVSESGSWCPALPMSLFTCLFICLPGVQLSGRLSSLVCQLTCLLVWLVCGSPAVCLHLSNFICLSVWLVVSGFLDVSLHVLPLLAGGVPLSGCLPT